jgi:hypothetical protein
MGMTFFTHRFCVSRRAHGGQHEIHRLGHSCSRLPDPCEHQDLGYHGDWAAAAAAARRYFNPVVPCEECLRHAPW